MDLIIPCQKVRYPNKDAARTALSKARQIYHSPKTLQYYLCQHCGGFHIGHGSKRRQRFTTQSKINYNRKHHERKHKRVFDRRREKELEFEKHFYRDWERVE